VLSEYLEIKNMRKKSWWIVSGTHVLADFHMHKETGDTLCCQGNQVLSPYGSRIWIYYTLVAAIVAAFSCNELLDLLRVISTLVS